MIRLTRNQVREVDRIAIERLGIPGIVLMENASRHAADAALSYLRDHCGRVASECHVAVCCGGGNNGGDGYAMARLLANAGCHVRIHAAKPIDELTGDAATNAAVCRNMDLPITDGFKDLDPVDLIVDALLGTGFHGEVRQPLDRAIRAINAARPPVLAVDVPSGLDCDTGEPARETVRAALTVTFVAEKVGFAVESAAAYLGRVIVADIGAPPGLISEVRQGS